MQVTRLVLILTSLYLISTRQVQGTTLEFFGEDINDTSTDCNEDAVRIDRPNADAAHDAFLAHLQDVDVEDFESFVPDTEVTTLVFGADTATLSIPLPVLSLPAGTFNGVYPISGDHVLLQGIGAPKNAFSIDFSAPQAVFGFYATDIEIQDNLLLRFHLADGVTTIDRPVPAGSDIPCPLENITGSVVFYGVIDDANPFVRVEFIRTLVVGDGFGFDDIVIGTVDDIVACPGDFDQSGAVAVNDLLALLSVWGTCPGCLEDLNGDDMVNVSDLLQLLSNWGPCGG